jgi:acetyl esterase/lipase
MKALFRSIALAAGLLLLAAAPRLSAQETYPFVERDSTLYLDVWRPAQPRPDSAAVIALFGGGFVSGSRDKDYQKKIAALLCDRGYTVISIDYRLGLKDKAKVEENHGLFKLTRLFHYCIDIAVEDCAAAIDWTVANAPMLGIAPNRVVLTGSSAGAITVLELDYCRVNGMPQAARVPDGWAPAAVVPYAGGLLCRKRELRWASAPAPTLLLHGEKDKIVAYKKFGLPLSDKMFGAAKVSKAMKKQGIPHWIVRIPGIGHEVASWLPGSVDIFCAFVDQALAGRVSTLDATLSDAELVPTRWTKMSLLDLYKQ